MSGPGEGQPHDINPGNDWPCRITTGNRCDNAECKPIDCTVHVAMPSYERAEKLVAVFNAMRKDGEGLSASQEFRILNAMEVRS